MSYKEWIEKTDRNYQSYVQECKANERKPLTILQYILLINA